MKIAKKLTALALVLVMLATIPAAVPETSAWGDETLTISPETNWTDIAAGGGTRTISVTSNTSWWVLAPFWIAVDNSRGEGNQSFTLTASANTSANSRTGTVWVPGGDVERQFIVTQAGEPRFRLRVRASHSRRGWVFGGVSSARSGETATLSASPRTGFRFDGWFDGNRRVSRRANYTHTITRNRTLTARFSPRRFRVTFNANGGQVMDSNSRWRNRTRPRVNFNARIRPPGRARMRHPQGHRFVGWYTTRRTGGTRLRSRTRMPARNVTYFARWQSGVTLAAFNSLRDGMTRQQVEQAFGGAQGRRQSSSTVTLFGRTTTYTSYRWEDGLNGSVSVGFTNNRLDFRSQFGLR